VQVRRGTARWPAELIKYPVGIGRHPLVNKGEKVPCKVPLGDSEPDYFLFRQSARPSRINK